MVATAIGYCIVPMVFHNSMSMFFMLAQVHCHSSFTRICPENKVKKMRGTGHGESLIGRTSASLCDDDGDQLLQRAVTAE
jgi:hypothetical protein